MDANNSFYLKFINIHEFIFGYIISVLAMVKQLFLILS